jgi:hypothetical protein
LIPGACTRSTWLRFCTFLVFRSNLMEKKKWFVQLMNWFNMTLDTNQSLEGRYESFFTFMSFDYSYLSINHFFYGPASSLQIFSIFISTSFFYLLTSIGKQKSWYAYKLDICFVHRHYWSIVHVLIAARNKSLMIIRYDWLNWDLSPNEKCKSIKKPTMNLVHIVWIIDKQMILVVNEDL